MGFNKKYLPDPPILKELIKNESYIKSCIKSDAVIGPTESVTILEEAIRKYLVEKKPV